MNSSRSLTPREGPILSMPRTDPVAFLLATPVNRTYPLYVYLKWNEIITAGSFVIAIMTRKKVKQKWISRASWLVCGTSALFLIYNIVRPDKSHSEGGQTAETK